MKIVIAGLDADYHKSFTDFKEAINFCENEYGYEGEEWNYVKCSNDLFELEMFLNDDGVFAEVDEESKNEQYLKILEQSYMEHGEEDARLAEEFMGVPAIEKQQEIIETQEKIIEEYESTLRYLNEVCFDCVEYQRKLQRENNPYYNFRLMDFAWATNDCIVDMPQVKELKEKLKELRGE